MSSELEPGDLAIITKSVMNLSIGKIVECVQIDYLNHPEYGTIWLVKSSREDLVSEYGGISDTFHVPKDWLKKIPKDPLPDEEDSLDLEHADGDLAEV